MDAKEEIRTRLNIEDVIGEYVELKRAGRSYKGLSPFTGEKTPSFFVSPEKNIWHDFSSNKGGDVFAFVMEAEGMDFRQALEFLARKAGVDLSDYQSANAKKRSAYRKRLLEANALAARYFSRACCAISRRLIMYSSAESCRARLSRTFKLAMRQIVVQRWFRLSRRKVLPARRLTMRGCSIAMARICFAAG